MYADHDSRGLAALLEMDATDRSVLKSACQMALRVWKERLGELYEVPVAELDGRQLERLFVLETRERTAGRIIKAISAVDREIEAEAADTKPFSL